MKSLRTARSSSTVTPGSPDRASSTRLGHSLQVICRTFVMSLTRRVICTGLVGFDGPGSGGTGLVPQPARHNIRDADNAPDTLICMARSHQLWGRFATCLMRRQVCNLPDAEAGCK